MLKVNQFYLPFSHGVNTVLPSAVSPVLNQPRADL